MGKTPKEIISIIDNKICSLALKIEGMNHIKGLLNEIATDAGNKIGTEMEGYFIYDNNHKLQILDDYMRILVSQVNKEFKEIAELNSELYEQMQVGRIIE